LVLFLKDIGMIGKSQTFDRPEPNKVMLRFDPEQRFFLLLSDASWAPLKGSKTKKGKAGASPFFAC
jgi:hypothetical protein